MGEAEGVEGARRENRGRTTRRRRCKTAAAAAEFSG